MTDHIQTREQVLDALRRELVGPSPAGSDLDVRGSIRFEVAKDSFGPWKDKGSGEEILNGDRPCKRYGIGVLYPLKVLAEEYDAKPARASAGTTEPESEPAAELTPDEEAALENSEKKLGKATEKVAGGEDLDLSGANRYRPSSMAVTFLGDLVPGGVLTVTWSGGCYRPLTVKIGNSSRTWWARKAVGGAVSFTVEELVGAPGTVLRRPVPSMSPAGPDLSIELLARPLAGTGPDSRQFLVTTCLVNRKSVDGPPDEACLFQTAFSVSITGPSKTSKHIAPYPRAASELADEEEQELAMLYREAQTFGVGHGCAAEWSQPDLTHERVETVRSECLPSFETQSITPDLQRPDGSSIEAPMAALAGLVPGDDGLASLREIVDLYGAWIEQQQEQAKLLPQHAAPAARHLKLCRNVHARMKTGLAYLQNNAMAREAFRLANHAMLHQQLRTTNRKTRSREYLKREKRWKFAEPFEPVAAPTQSESRGRWRAFQIAFLLMSLESTAEPKSSERETVELIWFPTGGGKTEAYLGLAAFSIFLRRLRGIEKKHPTGDAGVQVLMRYTLRLLTGQQFQRATALICAMEYLRRTRESTLGKKPFAIGIWVGGTPNTREKARKALKQLVRAGEVEDDNIVVLEKCPWCRAELGVSKARVGSEYAVHGYTSRPGTGGVETVVARCPDPLCDFHHKLPVEFVDEDLYEQAPSAEPVSLVIGTVDKFAMLAYRPEARALFGRAEDGTQRVSPPGLILQDELHLISGPLGSMVGLYETVVQELCTDRRPNNTAIPKVVTSTATIRRYREQIRSVFGRTEACLFPPPGLVVGDSFFARVARDKEGRPRRGRIYVGVHAPALGSSQTVQVRTFSALLQAPAGLTMPERDPWWTLLLFYNSLRELGGALTLFHSDIPGYIEAHRRRLGPLTADQRRHFNNLIELTGRLQNDEVTSALSSLEVEVGPPPSKTVDVCLASNIIEVGVDVDRLSLMAVVGQPKTTSQYIQVTGRVGRNWQKRPGLVITIYGAAKPRDRSHFEKFRTYHERLYAQVEPTSVTPFSGPALLRALHAVMVIYVRQTGNMNDLDRPSPVPTQLLGKIRSVLLDRVDIVDPSERSGLEAMLERRTKEWEMWEPQLWNSWAPTDDPPLLRWPGRYASEDFARRSWMTPSSMRNVDAECAVELTNPFLVPDPAVGSSAK